MAWVFVGGGLIAVVVFALWQSADMAKQRDAFLALNPDWEYTGTSRDYPSDIGNPRGRNSRVGHLFKGSVNGYRVIMFQDPTSRGRASTVHRSKIAIGLKHALPAISVTPSKGDYGRFFWPYEFLPGYGFDNPDHVVRSSDLEFAAQVVTPEVLSLSSEPVRLTKNVTRPIGWRIAGAYMVAWADQKVAPQEQAEIARLLTRIAESLPVEIWEKFGSAEVSG